MSLYSLKKIGLLAESRQAYLRGISGYNAGWVRDFSVVSDGFYDQHITARVEEAGVGYQVEVGLDPAGEVEHLACGCSRYRATRRGCKHIVAVLAHKYYQDMTQTQPVPAATPPTGAVTDPVARAMMDRYLSGERVRLTATQNDEEKVRLVPVLNLTGPTPAVTFSLGRDKLYQIKNLARFAGQLERGETVEYGRHLCFVHHRESFLPESRPLLDFLLSELAENPTAPGTVSAGGVGELRLSPGGFDRFFSQVLGSSLTVQDPTGERRVVAQEGYPTLTVTVEREGDGLRLFGDESRPVYGTHSLYLLHRGYLYRTGSEYTRRMTEWVRTVSRAPGGLYFAAAQLPAFCGGVLRGIRPHVRLQGEAVALETYAPPPLHTEILLDRTQDNVVTARVSFIYGGRVAYYDADPQPWQDPLAEWPVRLLLERYFAGRLEDGTLTAQWEDDRLYAFLTVALPRLRQLAQVSVTAAFDRRGLAPTPTVSLAVSLVDDLLRMHIGVEELDPAELAGIITGYRETRPYHRLRDGRLLSLEGGHCPGCTS